MDSRANTQLQQAVEKLIWKFLEENKDIVLNRLIGPDGLVLTAGDGKDINIDTVGTGKAYYNDVEIGSVGGDTVTSVFGRTGVVTAIETDYSAYYLLLTAGTESVLTGNLYINKTTPELHFEEGGATRGGLYVDASDNFIIAHAKVGGSEKLILGTVGTTGGSIDFEPRNAGVALSVSHTAITAAVGLVINPALTPTLYLQAGGVAQGYLQSTAGVLDLNSQVNGMLLGVPSTKTIVLRVAGTPVLTIAGAAITAAVTLAMSGTKITGLAAHGAVGDAVRYEHLAADEHTQYLLVSGARDITGDLNIDSATPFLTFENGATTFAYLGSNGVDAFLTAFDRHLSISTYGTAGKEIYFKTGTTSYITRLTIADAAITSAVTLAMSGAKITGLAAGTVAGNALRYEQLVGVYHLLSGALGDITTPSMGAKDIYFSDGYGIDLRNDDVHKLSYISASNAVRLSTYNSCQFYTTINTKTNLTIDSDGIRTAQAIFFRKNQASDTVYIVDDATANMEFHVGTGKVFEFIVD